MQNLLSKRNALYQTGVGFSPGLWPKIGCGVSQNNKTAMVNVLLVALPTTQTKKKQQTHGIVLELLGGPGQRLSSSNIESKSRVAHRQFVFHCGSVFQTLSKNADAWCYFVGLDWRALKTTAPRWVCSCKSSLPCSLRSGWSFSLRRLTPSSWSHHEVVFRAEVEQIICASGNALTSNVLVKRPWWRYPQCPAGYASIEKVCGRIAGYRKTQQARAASITCMWLRLRLHWLIGRGTK